MKTVITENDFINIVAEAIRKSPQEIIIKIIEEGENSEIKKDSDIVTLELWASSKSVPTYNVTGKRNEVFRSMIIEAIDDSYRGGGRADEDEEENH